MMQNFNLTNFEGRCYPTFAFMFLCWAWPSLLIFRIRNIYHSFRGLDLIGNFDNDR
jgi:hypothetical protein